MVLTFRGGLLLLGPSNANLLEREEGCLGPALISTDNFSPGVAAAFYVVGHKYFGANLILSSDA